MPISIRSVMAEDRADWDRLYAGYAEFYGVEQTALMRETVWDWLMDRDHGTTGLVAVNDAGRRLGIAHYRAFTRPLSATVGGFLDDLFVDPTARGQGVAEALIAAIRAQGVAKGWSVIRWITAEDNAPARRVYDRIAPQTQWVTYDLKL